MSKKRAPATAGTETPDAGAETPDAGAETPDAQAAEQSSGDGATAGDGDPGVSAATRGTDAVTEDGRFVELRAELVDLRAKLKLAAVDGANINDRLSSLERALRIGGSQVVSAEGAPVGGIRVRTKAKKRHFRAGVAFGRDWHTLRKPRPAQLAKIAADPELEVQSID